MSYHPTLGKWVQRDPAGYVDGADLYEYTQSNPTSATDPYGLFTSPEHGAITQAGLANSGLPPSLIGLIANSNIAQDNGAAFDRPPFSNAANHGDNGAAGILNTLNLMSQRWRNILNKRDKCANCDDVNALLQEFGRILHAIQDLYSHSNYAEIMDRAANGQSVPGTIPLWDMTGPIPGGVTTGNWRHPIRMVPTPAPTHGQMAKDDRTFPASQIANAAGTTMFDLARDLATRATAAAWAQLARQLYGSPAWGVLQNCINQANQAPAKPKDGELLRDVK